VAKVIQPPAAKRVTLDAKTSAELTFAIEPSVASQIAAGEYKVVATLDVPAIGTVKSGTWTGQARSEPVKLIIQDEPLRLTHGDVEKLELHFANYFYAVAKFPDAARHAEAALATNPKSISADIVLGEVKRAQGDLAGALEVFQKATLEFYQQNPNSYEPPTLLLSRISDLQEKLESAGPKAALPR
jgi:cytochrome c-type biogenesis protein CcmH/NrfG